MVSSMIIDDYLDALASAAPTPGGGASSAVVGAFGCAQGEMVARITMANPRKRDVAQNMELIIEELTHLRGEFLRLAERDAEGYERVARVLKMPRGSEHEREVRAGELACALAVACQAPFEMMDVADEALADVVLLAHEATSNVASDITCAASMLRAASDGAMATVLANTHAMGDRAQARAVNDAADEKRIHVTALAREAISVAERGLR